MYMYVPMAGGRRPGGGAAAAAGGCHVELAFGLRKLVRYDHFCRQ